MKMGICGDCLSDMPLNEYTKVPDHEVWECPKCNHPNSLGDLWEVWEDESQGS